MELVYEVQEFVLERERESLLICIKPLSFFLSVKARTRNNFEFKDDIPYLRFP